MLFDLLLQRPHDRHHLGVLLVVGIKSEQVQRFQFVDHESFDPVQFGLVVRICFEFPHCCQPFPSTVAPASLIELYHLRCVELAWWVRSEQSEDCRCMLMARGYGPWGRPVKSSSNGDEQIPLAWPE